MKPETPADPIAAMIQAMFSGGCTEEQIAAAKDAARSAKFAHLSDAELDALIVGDYPWFERLSTPEVEALIDAMDADADVDADTILALFASNTDLTAYSGESGHPVRRKVATGSDSIRPVSPKESGR
ncbi:hypothetical protein, partial [Thiocapsa roseopersicina]